MLRICERSNKQLSRLRDWLRNWLDWGICPGFYARFARRAAKEIPASTLATPNQRRQGLDAKRQRLERQADFRDSTPSVSRRDVIGFELPRRRFLSSESPPRPEPANRRGSGGDNQNSDRLGKCGEASRWGGAGRDIFAAFRPERA
jgi:hypothetical protein